MYTPRWDSPKCTACHREHARTQQCRVQLTQRIGRCVRPTLTLGHATAQAPPTTDHQPNPSSATTYVQPGGQRARVWALSGAIPQGPGSPRCHRRTPDLRMATAQAVGDQTRGDFGPAPRRRRHHFRAWRGGARHTWIGTGVRCLCGESQATNEPTTMRRARMMRVGLHVVREGSSQRTTVVTCTCTPHRVC